MTTRILTFSVLTFLCLIASTAVGQTRVRNQGRYTQYGPAYGQGFQQLQQQIRTRRVRPRPAANYSVAPSQPFRRPAAIQSSYPGRPWNGGPINRAPAYRAPNDRPVLKNAVKAAAVGGILYVETVGAVAQVLQQAWGK